MAETLTFDEVFMKIHAYHKFPAINIRRNLIMATKTENPREKLSLFSIFAVL